MVRKYNEVRIYWHEQNAVIGTSDELLEHSLLQLQYDHPTFIACCYFSRFWSKWMCGKCAQFFAAVLKASRWVMSGFTDLILWISSLMNLLYAEGTRCLFSGGRIGGILGDCWCWSADSNAALNMLRSEDEPQSLLPFTNPDGCLCTFWRSWSGREGSIGPILTENKLTQCPHLTVTTVVILLHGTLTARTVLQKLHWA